MTIPSRSLGRNGPSVSALGLGCMAMSGVYGPADRSLSIRTIHEALEAGVTLLDTGDFYGTGHNELLLREALAGGKRERAFIQVKFGAQRDPAGGWVGFDGRPASVKNYLAYTLERLGTDHVDVYMPARLDPAVPIEDTIGAIAEMVTAGYVRHIGLSEVGAGTIRRAHATHPIAALQIEYAIVTRGIEHSILPTCRELGIAITAYGVLSRGLLSDSANIKDAAKSGFRAHAPRFQGENLVRNLALTEKLRGMAAETGHTPAQYAIAWVLAQGSDIIPLLGARTPDRLAESLGALGIHLTREQLARLEAEIPPDAVAGTRYAAAQMAMLDSER